MDGTEFNDAKDSGSNRDVFKKKFTSLSRPRQPLRETNANLPTLLFKWNKKHTLSYSPPKGKDGRKSSPSKLTNATNIVSPTANKTKEEHKLARIGQTTPHSVVRIPIEVSANQFRQGLEKDEGVIPTGDDVTKHPASESREGASQTHEKGLTTSRKRGRDIVKKEEIEQSRTSTIRRKLSTTDKVEQVDKYLKMDSSDKSSRAVEMDRETFHEASLVRHKDPPKSDNAELTVMKEKDYISQAHVENWEQTGAINSKVSQHQHIEPPPQQEKTRTLIDTHNTAKASNVHFKDSKVPLQVLDTNKLDRKLLERPEKRKLAQQQAQYQKGTSRLSGEELFQWQQSWKKIMRESVVFFEGTHDFQLSEYKKAVKYLKYVGSEIAPFYRTNVTIIISKRTYDDRVEYPSNDIFSNVPKFKTKVWSYEKLFRFMKNLGLSNVSDDQLSTDANANTSTAANNNLYNLLKEEKLYGVADRDPNARRDDYHYFSKNYLYVYDLSQTVRPIAVREWGSDYPVLHLTLDGKCPFIDDPSDQNLERKRLKRFKKFEATKSHRQALRAATERVISGVSLSAGRFNGTSTSTDKVEESSHGEVEFRQPLTRNSSCIQSKAVDAMASGFNGASNAVQFSMDSNLNSTAVAAGNGLGPSLSQVQSKNLNNLKRRIFLKRKTSERRDKESTPGYCENCRCKYDNFEDHIYSNRHRNFACDDRNFADIDELIATLKESNSMGNITSNGDYI